MMIPSQEDCLKLMDQFGMLENIVSHSIIVAKVALFLASELNKKGQRIDYDLVEASSLLHDLTKTECLKTREDHAVTGGLLLKKMGYERVGEVVAEHIQLSARRDPLWVSEEELVNYADKRVQHDRIVSLEKRFIDLKDRYGKGKWTLKQLEQLEKSTFDIENKIFSILNMDPDELGNLQLSHQEGRAFVP